MQSQGIITSIKPKVALYVAHVSTKGSCVNPSGQDPNTDASDRRGLYIDGIPPCQITLGRVYEGSSTVHHVHLENDVVKVGVEEIWDLDAHIPTPIEEVQLVGQALNTFIAWPKHLVKPFSEKGISFLFCLLFSKKWFDQNKVLTIIKLCLLTVRDEEVPKKSKKPVDRLKPDDDPIYQMTLMILQLFLKPMQVSCGVQW